LNDGKNDELETIWKEVAIALSRSYPRICMEELRKAVKTSMRIASSSVEIQMEGLLNTSLGQ
jgi:hypothetical protein